MVKQTQVLGIQLGKNFDRTWAYLRFLLTSFFKDDCTYRASALTFTSLLAIVPLMSVSITILTAFPDFSDWVKPIQNFIFDNFVPATGREIQQYLETFTQQASKLSLFGLAFLFVTSVLLMFTIERAMNRIWKVQKQRLGPSAFLLYWTILSLSPLLLGLSIAASSYLMTLPLLSQASAMGANSLLHVAPFLLSFLGLSFLYIVVPNCRVSLPHGLIGALIAAIFFEAAKFAFRFYLGHFHTYELLYGAFAIVPLFFVWVYWVWLIVLFGAEIAHSCSAFRYRIKSYVIDEFTQSIEWLYLLWQAQSKGEGLAIDDLLAHEYLASDIQPEAVLQRLHQAKLVQFINGGEILLARDLSSLSFGDLSMMLPWPIPRWQRLVEINLSAYAKSLVKHLKAIEDNSHPLTSQPVAALFAQEKTDQD